MDYGNPWCTMVTAHRHPQPFWVPTVPIPTNNNKPRQEEAGPNGGNCDIVLWALMGTTCHLSFYALLQRLATG